MMKSEPKAFASLSSGLLARKGAARPAMRPQGFGQMGSGLDDLGWNDMGFEPPKPALATVPADSEPASPRVNPVTGLSPISPVHVVQETIVQRLSQDSEEEDLDETAEPVAPDAPPLSELLADAVQAESVAPVAPVAPVVPVAPVAPVAPVMVAPVAKVAKAPRPRQAAGSKAKAAFTLRLDADRHLKLRLAAAVTGTSAQQLVTRALDLLLGSMPEVDAMAERAPERGASKR
jgi:hypothetical protein